MINSAPINKSIKIKYSKENKDFYNLLRNKKKL